MLIVVVMMATLLGVAVLAGGEITAQGRETATRASMQAIRDAIVGGSNELVGGRSFRRDIGELPQNVSTAPVAERTWSLSDLLDGSGVPEWRGPYITAPRGVFGVERDSDPSWTRYGFASDWAVLDAWGNPIVLQVPDLDGFPANVTGPEREHARLVSAGPDGRIDTPAVGTLAVPYPLLAESDDDIVLYMQVADLRRDS